MPGVEEVFELLGRDRLVGLGLALQRFEQRVIERGFAVLDFLHGAAAGQLLSHVDVGLVGDLAAHGLHVLDHLLDREHAVLEFDAHVEDRAAHGFLDTLGQR